jgi:site-specific DNA-adenine methylase
MYTILWNVKDFISNLNKWDVINYKGESYTISDIDWDIFELDNYKIVSYDDLFTDLSETKQDYENDYIIMKALWK